MLQAALDLEKQLVALTHLLGRARLHPRDGLELGEQVILDARRAHPIHEQPPAHGDERDEHRQHPREATLLGLRGRLRSGVALGRASSHSVRRGQHLPADVQLRDVPARLVAGLNLSVQSYGSFERFGGQDLLGMFAGIGGVRELYPVMAAVVCGARIGANLAASLANMRISEQIEALDAESPDRLGWSCFGVAGEGVEVTTEPEEVPWGIHANVVDLYGNPYNLVEERV